MCFLQTKTMSSRNSSDLLLQIRSVGSVLIATEYDNEAKWVQSSTPTRLLTTATKYYFLVLTQFTLPVPFQQRTPHVDAHYDSIRRSQRLSCVLQNDRRSFKYTDHRPPAECKRSTSITKSKSTQRSGSIANVGRSRKQKAKRGKYQRLRHDFGLGKFFENLDNTSERVGQRLTRVAEAVTTDS